MIYVTKLNGDGYYLNPCHIESIEANPDTTILLMNGKKLIVKEDVVEVVDKIKMCRREIALLDRIIQENKGVEL
ncbi:MULTISPECIES: flagellar FlbD family protein [Borrelia]|uniref:Flagellar protein FlbD n=2 Tax=Borrelia turicatae TaxID=142 RepID=A0A172XAR4_BORTU|nr:MULTISPECIES: flagellar FlbD family protein [Borrelia]AAX17620.1 motility protein [Borrelia turicatae 91E135]ANF33774.1 flagellar protein FlbD [Borrelia turicatae]UPA11968.1 flagellar FlbD family protein [Borrelia venezuelensis]UPA13142.1 flagellar FlbD family protein [Borrelia turicatae 91E135]UPA14627.1 flagellar FlbD family protein [Borrelia turicatae]